MSWEELERKPGNVSEAERLEGKNKEEDFDKHLVRAFQSDSGKIVWERWKRTILDKRIDIIMTNPATGAKQGTPQELIFAKVGEENFIKDIQARMERVKNL